MDRLEKAMLAVVEALPHPALDSILKEARRKVFGIEGDDLTSVDLDDDDPPEFI